MIANDRESASEFATIVLVRDGLRRVWRRVGQLTLLKLVDSDVEAGAKEPCDADLSVTSAIRSTVVGA